MIPKIEALWAARDTLSFVALGITAATVAVILLLRRWRPRWPVLVIAVAAASLASGWFHLPVDTVASRFGALPSGLPAPHWPEITQARLIEMLPSAFLLAFLAGVDSLPSAIVSDRLFAGQHRPSAPLIAPGPSQTLPPPCRR